MNVDLETDKYAGNLFLVNILNRLNRFVISYLYNLFLYCPCHQTVFGITTE